MTIQEFRLLKEIKKIKKLNEKELRKELQKMFENLSFDEELKLRSMFKTLKENGFINVVWADNIPYILVLTEKGQSYNCLKFLFSKLKYILKPIKCLLNIFSKF